MLVQTVVGNKYIKRFVFLLLLLVLVVTRLYNIDTVPFGLHVDEAGMAYDAWSLANFGVDRYLNSFPVYFINYGGGQSIMYGYLSAFLIKLFGLSIYTIRLPGVFFSLITGLIGFNLVKKWFNSFYFGLLYLFIFTITPYFIMQARFGLDCNLMMGMSSVVLYFIDRMIQSDRYIFSILAGFVTGLILYTYALSYIVIPVFLVLLFIYTMAVKKVKSNKLIIFTFVLFIVSLPLILLVFVNYFNLGSTKFLWFTVPQLPGFRGSEITFSLLEENFKKVFDSVLRYDWLIYNTFSNHLTLYKVSIPFVIIGFFIGLKNIIVNIHNKKYSLMDIVWLFGLSTLFMGLLLGGDQPNTNKMNGIFFSVSIILLIGIIDSFKCFSKIKPWIGKLFLIFLIITYSYHFISFSRYYYFRYKDEINPQYLFAHPFSDAFIYVNENIDKSKQVNIEPNYQGYIYFLLSSKTSPYDFDIQTNGVDSYLNYNFNLPHDIDIESVYLVAKTNTSFIDRISNLGFSQIEFELYYLYVYED